jgi:hypothetical protein
MSFCYLSSYRICWRRSWPMLLRCGCCRPWLQELEGNVVSPWLLLLQRKGGSSSSSTLTAVVEKDDQQQQHMKTNLCLQSQQLDAQVHHAGFELAFIHQPFTEQRCMETDIGRWGAKSSRCGRGVGVRQSRTCFLCSKLV